RLEPFECRRIVDELSEPHDAPLSREQVGVFLRLRLREPGARGRVLEGRGLEPRLRERTLERRLAGFVLGRELRAAPGEREDVAVAHDAPRVDERARDRAEDLYGDVGEQRRTQLLEREARRDRLALVKRPNRL